MQYGRNDYYYHHQQTGLMSPSPTLPPVGHITTPEERVGRILNRTLKLTSVLGIGAYGVVYSATCLKTGTPFAVKALNKFNRDGSILDDRQVQFQRREIELHHMASNHPNIVSTLKILDDVDCTYVILEYCPEGDLFSNITEKGKYIGNDRLAKDVFLQVLAAVEHCHNLGIYHRDLKPENILVSNEGQTVKLADFGLATSDIYTADFGCGSTFYMSPECQEQNPRNPFYFCAPNDIWSLGVILVNLTCGRNPWKKASIEDSTFRAYMKDRQFLKSILPLSEELNEILGLIFEVNPDRRIGIQQLKHRIQSCSSFTRSPQPTAQLPTPPISNEGNSILANIVSRNSNESVRSDLSDEGSLISDTSSDDSMDIQEPSEYSTSEALPAEVQYNAKDAVPRQEYQQYYNGHDPYVEEIYHTAQQQVQAAQQQYQWEYARQSYENSILGHLKQIPQFTGYRNCWTGRFM